ncbi:4-trimethylaminobutyraldehyde dehydrogenase [Plectosphaerella cucumerina]|uniref:aldehyde dehydrogenase (NAD(+)) n=1 Tax=Plectosphaerella cucumerina TaxID=40658 RepID=A0A8K0X5M0_9PEZI|nr:4-trimethylaminobutyraldehyde dehydrogenase [Plectosphaerella cucumerina]
MVAFETFSNVIDGKLQSTATTRHGVNPATLEDLPPVPVSSQEDLDVAVAAAAKATTEWQKVPIEKRRDAVSRLADALEAQADDFAAYLTKEQGKPGAQAQYELVQAIGVLRGVAQLPFGEEVVEDSEQARVITRYVPIGVAAGIVPWNFPIVLLMFKLAPAVITGNSIIIKPSPFTPYCGLKVVELAQQFFPPGVVQALSGDDNLGPWLTAHPGIQKISFTGSTATGIRVMQSCAKTLKRVTLELGGNDAAIVCSSVDIAAIAPAITGVALYNSGQVCIAIKRIYVHSSIYREFLDAMVAYAKTLVVGDGSAKDTTHGPVQNKMQYDRVKGLIASIEAEKLNIAFGDLNVTAAQKKGYFINPVIVENPPDESKIVVDEPFGPVFPVMKWTDEDEVIRRANNTDMGLGASVWTKDQEQADRLSRQLQAGTVWVNTHMELRPDAAFGGHKFSGVGTELGINGLKSYCNIQTIHQKKA